MLIFSYVHIKALWKLRWKVINEDSEHKIIMKQITVTIEHHIASSKITHFFSLVFMIFLWECEISILLDWELVWLSILRCNNTKYHSLILYYAIDLCVTLWQISGQRPPYRVKISFAHGLRGLIHWGPDGAETFNS